MIKNVAANVPMIGLRKGAEALSIGVQKALTASGVMDEAARTRGWATKEQRQLARDYYNANKADINGQSNKLFKVGFPFYAERKAHCIQGRRG